MSNQVDRRTAKEVWFEKAFERFPFTLFSGVQSFMLFQNFTDFLGGVVEFPLALIQLYSTFYAAHFTQYQDNHLHFLTEIANYNRL